MSPSDPAAVHAPLGTVGVLIAGEERTPGDGYLTRSPYDGAPAAHAHLGGAQEVADALDAVTRAFAVTKRLPSYRRSEILAEVSSTLSRDRERFAEAIAREAGKPIGAALGEADRAAFTFKVASEEALRIGGEIVPLDWLPGMDGSRVEIRSVPLGPVSAITPFNYPLNLVAHKLAPALAAGDPIALRPDARTPTAAVLLGRAILEAGWPADGLAVVPTEVEHAAPFVEDDRLKLFSFTGSPRVGWMLKNRAGRKRVTLELGGNAGTIVHADADVARAVERIVWGGFSYSGQSCISVQRVFVHDDVYDELATRLAEAADALVTGDPMDPATDVGPVIDAASAERIASWLDEAKAAGATVLAGGTVDGTVVRPTVLADVDESAKVVCEEIFGPVLSLLRYTDAEDALARLDDSDFGLQAGLFTSDYDLIERAFERVEVGGLVVGDVSTFRVDHQPYGGVKASGFGREGIRSAIEDMTERKVLLHRKYAREGG
jgi:glyceraldehyde-3-phosphate dehydrogenase (NADP+)